MVVATCAVVIISLTMSKKNGSTTLEAKLASGGGNGGDDDGDDGDDSSSGSSGSSSSSGGSRSDDSSKATKRAPFIARGLTKEEERELLQWIQADGGRHRVSAVALLKRHPPPPVEGQPRKATLRMYENRVARIKSAPTDRFEELLQFHRLPPYHQPPPRIIKQKAKEPATMGKSSKETAVVAGKAARMPRTPRTPNRRQAVQIPGKYDDEQ